MKRNAKDDKTKRSFNNRDWENRNSKDKFNRPKDNNKG